MCNFENILRFSHFSIALDMSRITHFLAEITHHTLDGHLPSHVWSLPLNSLEAVSVIHRVFNELHFYKLTESLKTQ